MTVFSVALRDLSSIMHHHRSRVAHLSIAAILGSTVVLSICYMSSLFVQTTVGRMESSMFLAVNDAALYKANCGADWHKLFRKWEQTQKSVLSGASTEKIIVWRCIDKCGGLGDRQRGILTSFTLALVTGRAFFIDSQQPVPLQSYFSLANRKLHWVYEDSILQGLSVLEESFMDAFPSIGDYAEANLTYYEKYDVVIQRNNFWKPLSILKNPVVAPDLAIWSTNEHTLAGCILNYLLVPTREMQLRVANVNKHENTYGKAVVALQVRSGDSQVKNYTVMKSLVNAYSSCFESIETFSKSAFTLFLSTDSDTIVAQFRKQYDNLLTFDGQITHVDGIFGADDNPVTAFDKVMLDHLMISRAEVIIISRSGFGEFAALRGFKSYFVPPRCGPLDQISHYVFPADMQAGDVDDILQPSFSVRSI